MVTNTFFANLRTRFYKMDIFKNVQNENLEMNLEKPFFLIPILYIFQESIYIFIGITT